MSNSPHNGKGKAFLWITEHISYSGDECLTWPFGALPNGYGRLTHLGVPYYAHRLMCTLANGEPTDPSHEVRHTCGNGNQRCVNPKHLEWGTRRQNLLDQSAHGRGRNAWWGPRGKLSRQQVHEIKALKGKMTAIAIAEIYPVVTANTIRTILRGETHRADAKKRGWLAEDDAVLMANAGQLESATTLLGRSWGSVRTRAYKLGLLGK